MKGDTGAGFILGVIASVVVAFFAFMIWNVNADHCNGPECRTYVAGEQECVQVIERTLRAVHEWDLHGLSQSREALDRVRFTSVVTGESGHPEGGERYSCAQYDIDLDY